jgi:hypothetical protein
MSQQRIKLVSGSARDVSYQTPNGDGSFGCGFTSSDTLSCIVWAGDQSVSVATPTVIWGNNGTGTAAVTAAAGAAITLWTITFQAADTASLTPGIYRIQVFGTHGSKTATLFDGILEIVSTAGSNSPADLVSYTTVETLLARLRLRESEREMIPFLVTEASQAVVKWCGQRDFIRQTYVQEYVPDLNGYCMLEQMPVNNVLRVRGYSQTVLTITAATSAFQQAWVNFSTSGQWYTNTLVYTGLVLNSISSGNLVATPLLYATYPTVNQLSSAVGSISGWSSLTQPTTYGLYPSTDLMSQGTSQGAMTDDGCNLRAYTEDLSWTSLDNATGAFYAGRRRPSCNQFGPQWGDDWQLLEEADSGPTGRIQVTYDAGFTVVPFPVQEAVTELVKASIERLRTDHQLGQEDNGVYKYKIEPSMVNFLPRPILQKLALYRMSRAR